MTTTTLVPHIAPTTTMAIMTCHNAEGEVLSQASGFFFLCRMGLKMMCLKPQVCIFFFSHHFTNLCLQKIIIWIFKLPALPPPPYHQTATMTTMRVGAQDMYTFWACVCLFFSTMSMTKVRDPSIGVLFINDDEISGCSPPSRQPPVTRHHHPDMSQATPTCQNSSSRGLRCNMSQVHCQWLYETRTCFLKHLHHRKTQGLSPMVLRHQWYHFMVCFLKFFLSF